MDSLWYIKIGFWILLLADVMFLQLVYSVSKERYGDKQLTKYKYLFIASILALFFAASVLMLVYADALWVNKNLKWLLPFAVIGNAISKIISALLFQLMRRTSYKV